MTVIPYTLRYSDLFRNKVLHYKANYILYNYFTEITSGVGTFGGASQSAFRNQCWTAGWLAFSWFSISWQRVLSVTATDHQYLLVTVCNFFSIIHNCFLVFMFVHGWLLLLLLSDCFGEKYTITNNGFYNHKYLIHLRHWKTMTEMLCMIIFIILIKNVCR